MIKIIFVLLTASFIIHDFVYPQSGWIQQYNSNTQPITKISFFDENTGWCSSSGGAMYSSMGYLIKTANGGTNWTILLQSGIYFSSFHFVGLSIGWVTGGTWNDVSQISRRILRTTNGGSTWELQYLDTVRGAFKAASFADYFSGIVVGTTYLSFPNSSMIVLRTTDAGLNWIADSNGTAQTLNDVQHIDTLIAWAAGGNNGQILKTINGGSTWVQKFTSPGVIFNDIYFYNPSVAWVCGEAGKIYKTTDGGNLWLMKNSGSNAALNEIFFVNRDTGFIAGGDSYYQSKIFKTIDGGNNWFVDFEQNGFGISSIYFINSSTGWTAGGNASPFYSGVILKTTTGGTIGIKSINNKVPAEFSLKQNYPNPFNPVTNIQFSIPEKSYVTLEVFDVLGRRIEILADENLTAGTYEASWDGSEVSSGVYFYRLQTDEFTQTKKMILVE